MWEHGNIMLKVLIFIVFILMNNLVDILFSKLFKSPIGDAIVFTDLSHAYARSQFIQNFAFMRFKVFYFGTATLFTPHMFTLGFTNSHCLACALRIQFMLYFSGNTKCETQHFTIETVVEDITIFRAMYCYSVIYTEFHYFHDFMERTRKTRQFSHNENIAFFKLAYGAPQLALLSIRFTTNTFSYPTVNYKVIDLSLMFNFAFLIFKVLTTRTNSEISNYHKLNDLKMNI